MDDAAPRRAHSGMRLVSGEGVGAVSLGVVALLGLGGAPAAQAQVPTVTAIERVRLVDGTGGAPVPDATLILREGRIVRMGPGLRAPAGARVVDLKGRTVIPGLISDHSHVGLVDGVTVTPEHYNRDNILRQLRQYEAYGVTTVTTLGLNRSPLFDQLRPEMHAGITPGADLYGVDQGIGVPEGAPHQAALPVGPDQIFRPDTPQAARQAVDTMADRGTDLVKLWLDDFRNGTDKPGYPKMKPEIYRAVIAEAHARGLRVAAHVYYLDDAKRLVAEGADIIAHGVRDQPVDPAFIAAVKARGVWYIPTLGLDESGYIFAEHPELLQDRFLSASLQPALRAQLADPAWRAKVLASPAVAAAKRALAINQQNLKTLYDAGANIGFGTDSGATALRIPGWAEHRELKLMVQAGLTPAQALSVATRSAAALMHLQDRGVLAAGKRADFVVLESDPTADIAAADKIEAVWRGGVQADGPVRDFAANATP